ncbi:MAG: hypothetical protein LBQ96_05685 [Fusobacteriaceae bacterium]|jgi:antitoxin component YwqK of YwqJK toxin-antitoxin module|nr:hypothetical protein [Fusobacteriaceae bacterium]
MKKRFVWILWTMSVTMYANLPWLQQKQEEARQGKPIVSQKTVVTPQPRYEGVHSDLIEIRNGTAYKSGEARPYTGNILYFYPTGKIQRVVEYQNGEECGKETNYYENGQINEVFTRRDHFTRVGKYIRYHENGKLLTERAYDAYGASYDPIKYYDDKGRLMRVQYGDMQANVLHMSEEYYSDGPIRERVGQGKGGGLLLETFLRSGRVMTQANASKGTADNRTYEALYTGTGLSCKWIYPDGQRIYHEKGKGTTVDGTFRSTYENGRLRSEETFLRGLRKNYIYYYKNGMVEKRFQGGILESYYLNGNLEFKATTADGISPRQYLEQYYENGQIKEKSGSVARETSGVIRPGEWEEGVHVTFSLTFYENGNPKVKTFTAVDGKRIRTIEYYNNGNMKTLTDSESDSKIHEKHYYESGTLAREDFYSEPGPDDGNRRTVYQRVSYHENGTVKETRTYDKGKLIKVVI